MSSHWLTVPVYFKNSSLFSLYSSIFIDKFQKAVRCCEPDAILNKSQDLHHFFLEDITLKVFIQILPWSVSSTYDFFFTFASLPGNGNRSERSIFIFSAANCKPLWASKKMLGITKCKSIIYRNDTFQNIFPFGVFFFITQTTP